MLLRQQSGVTKFPCFLCEWNSMARDQHWMRKTWPPRINLTPGQMNIQWPNLVESTNVMLPPLHINLGLMKQFEKALTKDGQCFQYLSTKFPHLSAAKKRRHICRPWYPKLSDSHFESQMTLTEKETWVSFKNAITKFLGNTKDSDYINIVGNMLEKFNKLGCLMNLKIISWTLTFSETIWVMSARSISSNGKTLSGSLGYQYDGRLLLVTSTRS